MEKLRPAKLHPDLVISTEAAIDRMGLTASKSVEQEKPNYQKQIQLVRSHARELCTSYRNCRGENWCFHCSSGQFGPFFRELETCQQCKLVTADALINHKLIGVKGQNLIQIHLSEDFTDIT